MIGLMNEPDLSREWQRGLLATCALAVLAQGNAHGYAVSQHLQKAGIGAVKGGALYPVLNRLEADGAVTSQWREGDGGPGRKVFGITVSGRERLSHMQSQWPPFAVAVAGLLGVDPGVTTPAPAAAEGQVPEH